MTADPTRTLELSWSVNVWKEQYAATTTFLKRLYSLAISYFYCVSKLYSSPLLSQLLMVASTVYLYNLYIASYVILIAMM